MRRFPDPLITVHVMKGHCGRARRWFGCLFVLTVPGCLGDHRQRFDTFVSDFVLSKSARGDPSAAARRLARAFVQRRLILEKVLEDAFHVAIATTQGMDFLLTWNCRHIANTEIIDRLEAVCEEFGYQMPTLCRPEQLMGEIKP